MDLYKQGMFFRYRDDVDVRKARELLALKTQNRKKS